MAPFFLILVIWFPFAFSLPTPPYTLSPLGWFYVPTPNTTSPTQPPSLAPRSLPSSGHITLNDYPSLSAIALNPPYCGFAYNYPLLDLTRVTAMETATPTDCGTCLRVCGAAGCKEVLVIDKGGRGLDLSTGARDTVLGTGQDIGWAEWGVVDSTFCQGVVRGGDVGGREEDVQADTAASGAGVVETVFTVPSTQAPSSNATTALGPTEALVSLSSPAGSSWAAQLTSDAPASPVAEPTDEAGFVSALADPSATPAPAFFAPASATDEEAFLSALMVETPSPDQTTLSASSSLVTTAAQAPSYPTSETSSTRSASPDLTTAISSLSVSSTLSSTSSSASLAVATAKSAPSASSLATTPVTASANFSSPASASAPSPPPTYIPTLNSSAYVGVLHPIVASGATRPAPALQWSDWDVVLGLLLTLLTTVLLGMEETRCNDRLLVAGLWSWWLSSGWRA
ncbi:hypothetical protein MMC27_006983 [Xylographa pallens]|nr:hypothetical protein [Xylographa pallens]